MNKRTVVVTGGTKGLGRAIAARFLQAGADVITCARRPPAEPLEVDGRTATFVAADVRDSEQLDAVVAAAVDATGRIDVLVNNAGGAPPAAASESSASFNEKILALNLLAPMNLSRACNEVMQGQDDGGVIINIASVSGMRANPHGAAYGAAKAGLLNLTETLALEWAPKVRCVAITPGPLATDALLGVMTDEAVARISDAIALGRMGDPDEVANAVLFAASAEASFITGTNLVVHGGPEWPGNGYPKPQSPKPHTQTQPRKDVP